MIGPMTSNSIAGNINAPVGRSIFTGAFATISSRFARYSFRASSAKSISSCVKGAPKRSARNTLYVKCLKDGVAIRSASCLMPSSRLMRPFCQMASDSWQ